MSSLNQVTLVGNLGDSPKIRSMQNGNRVANLSIATSEKWTDKHTGEKREKTEWHRVNVFNEGLVGVIEKYVKKGSKVLVQGKLQTRKWTDDQGIERYVTEIVLQGFNGQLVMLGNGRDQGGAASSNEYTAGNDYQSQGGHSGGGSAAGFGHGPNDVGNSLDDDIPF